LRAATDAAAFEALEYPRDVPEGAIEVVTAMYAAWNAGEWGLERFHPDAECELIGKAGFDQADTLHGRDALLGYWRRFWGAWKPGARWDIKEFQRLDDEQVLACGHLHVTGRSSGVETSVSIFQLWTVRDGLVVRLVGCDDRATALAAAS
jgi:ketosteroid isomerase-like protein